MNLSRNELLKFLEVWTQFMWECLDDKETWIKDGHAEADAQLKDLIENYFDRKGE